MFNDKLDKLIEMALMDGVITEKERNALFKKAKEIGVDLDEFEMVLDAKLVEKQKEGAPTKNKDNVLKCPSCNDIIPALSRICPSCDYVLDSRKQSSGSEKSLEDLINDIEENLVVIKSLPQSNVFSSLIKHSYISFSLLTIIVVVIGIKLKIGILFLVAVVMIILSIIMIRKKIKSREEEKSTNYANQKALFEKHSRNANTLFGDNKKVKLLLSDLKVELDNIDQERTKNKKIEIITYAILVIFTIGVFFIPSKKSVSDIGKENKKADSELIIKAEDLINNNKLEDAKLIIKDLKTDESKVIIKSKIQLANLVAKLNTIEPLLEKKKYSKIKLELNKLVWKKISTEYSTTSIERDIYKTFLQKKEAINNQLPEKYKVKIRSEYSL